MAIKGIGTDIVQIKRVEKAVKNTANFAARILGANELLSFQQSHNPSRLLAKRFAAKEACLKALGTGLAQGMRWHDIEVIHTELGQPQLLLFGAAKKRAEALGVTRLDISISDEVDYAIAFVVLS